MGFISYCLSLSLYIMSSCLMRYSVLLNLIRQMQARVGRCVELQQQMQNRFGLLDMDVMPIFIIIALDIVITLHFSINCSIVICLPTICFLSREKDLVKPMALGLFSIIYFHIYKPKIPKIPCCNLFVFTLFYVLVIFYIYLYHISPLQVTVKGLTTPLSRWVQVFDCLCRCIDWRLACTSYWIYTLVL